MNLNLDIIVLKDYYSVCKLDKDKSIPSWAFGGEFSSVTKTDEELSIICNDGLIPQDITRESSWRILKIRESVDFCLTGTISNIIKILEESYISIFAISTYDSDYLLVKDQFLETAIATLTNSGVNIISNL